jgi:type 1 fimbriae regulatory protein FimB
MSAEARQVDTDTRVLHVVRLKRGLSTDHPLRADELRMIAAWLKERNQLKVPVAVKTFFVSERRRPLHRSTVNLLLEKGAKRLEAQKEHWFSETLQYHFR